jgi:hypothetical protein
MSNKNSLKKIFPVILLLLFTCCREEIIPPGNTGNINEPLLTVTSNSYIFSVNASNMNVVVTDRTNLQSVRTRLYSLISDHTSGYVEVKVQTNNNYTVFAKVYNSDTSGSFENIEGYKPDIITFNFNNFTGRLKLQLTRSD